MIRERSAEVNRLQKVLEGANIKLASVATDVVGVSGRLMLASLVDGVEDPVALAALARGKLKNKRAALEEALEGRLGQHQRFMLAAQLSHLAMLDDLIEQVSREIEHRLAPLEDEIQLLTTIPGIGRRTAETLLSEVGPDVSRFPSARHLASWAGLCPGNNESGGKSFSGRTRKGSPWLRSALVEAARSAAKSRSYLGVHYRRLAARRGANRAAVAVAHTLLTIAYHMLTRRQPYIDLGANYFDELKRDQVCRRLTHRLEALGYDVELRPLAS